MPPEPHDESSPTLPVLPPYQSQQPLINVGIHTPTLSHKTTSFPYWIHWDLTDTLMAMMDVYGREQALMDIHRLGTRGAYKIKPKQIS